MVKHALKFCFWGNIYSSLKGEAPGGGELQISYLISGLGSKGFHVVIIDFVESNDHNYDSHIKVISLKKRCKSI